jgi:cytochrome c oxidase assembly factor CtaG
MNMMLLAGLLLAMGFTLVVLMLRAVSRRHRHQDLGAVSAQWLMSNRIER